MNQVDVAILGATGYTGRLVCDYLGKRAEDAGRTWSVAGRRKEALDELVDKHGAASAIIVDCENEADCTALAETAKVVVNIAGPYYERAEKIVAACARSGTHYFDLTGELVFVRGLIDQFHDEAVESGAKIAPISGYESLPFDLMALALLEGFEEAHGHAPNRIDILTENGSPPEGASGMSEMISGGTAETMRVMLEKDKSGISSDPAALNPVDDPAIETVRRVSRHDLMPKVDDLEPQTMPMIPSPFLTPAVVNRTFALLRAEGAEIPADILYRERMSTKGLGPEWSRGITSFMAATGNNFLGWVTNSSFDAPKRMMKAMMDWAGPKPGEGPSLELLDSWDWGLKGRARDKDGNEVTMTLKGAGHPGYRTTANMIAEAGLILSDPDADVPDRAGILTPASALGVKELKRFARAGMEYSELEIHRTT
ncbi:MAG: saccharopine dehydrogenase family protein [Alphaproteobacteria bacterium]